MRLCAAASPVATAVSTTTLWSTGRVDAGISVQRYSQTFTLKAGTYYFGDLDYYNLSNSVTYWLSQRRRHSVCGTQDGAVQRVRYQDDLLEALIGAVGEDHA